MPQCSLSKQLPSKVSCDLWIVSKIETEIWTAKLQSWWWRRWIFKCGCIWNYNNNNNKCPQEGKGQKAYFHQLVASPSNLNYAKYSPTWLEEGKLLTGEATGELRPVCNATLGPRARRRQAPFRVSSPKRSASPQRHAIDETRWQRCADILLPSCFAAYVIMPCTSCLPPTSSPRPSAHLSLHHSALWLTWGSLYLC